MSFEIIKNDLLEDKYFKTTYENGFEVCIYPKKGQNSKYVLMGTRFGSINNRFKSMADSEEIGVPDGIAHFLEHKMFENEEGSAFSHYSKTGASANAYTSFDRTCYMFSCSENFDKSLEILLRYIFNPCFTQESIDKEQGIIGQEIKMYEDDPNWQATFGVLKSMYKNHPINIDIAGTVETIATITPEKLYHCYNNFYNPANMAIAIVGDFEETDVEKLFSVFEKIGKTAKTNPLKIFPKEPYEVAEKRLSRDFPVSSTIFNLGFKENRLEDEFCTCKEKAETDVLLEIIASKHSKLYRKLLDSELINVASFYYEYFYGPGYSAVTFSGESKDPDMVETLIKEAILELRNSGIKEEDFERAKKSVFGGAVAAFNSSDTIANSFIELKFNDNETLYDYVMHVKNMNLEDVKKRFENQLDVNNSSLSIIKPFKN